MSRSRIRKRSSRSLRFVSTNETSLRLPVVDHRLVRSLCAGPVRVAASCSITRINHHYSIEDIILSTGPSPRLPRVLAVLQPPQWTTQSTLSVPIFHTSYYMISISALLAKLTRSETPLKVAMVGGGQSCAECLIDLYNRFEGLPHGGHQIDMIIRKGSLKPSDDTPFVNEIFDPAGMSHLRVLSARCLIGVIYEQRPMNGTTSQRTVSELRCSTSTKIRTTASSIRRPLITYVRLPSLTVSSAD